MIPRTFHTVWPGFDEFRGKFHAWRVSWMAFHPDATFLFHRLDVPPECVEQRRVQNIMNRNDLTVVSKSDVLRYAVIEALGGVYIDADCECVGEIDEWLSPPSGFAMRYCDEFCPGTRNPHLDPCFFMAMPHHPASQALLYGALEAVEQRPARDVSTNPNVHTGPYMCSARLGHAPIEWININDGNRVIHHYNGMSDTGWTKKRNMGLNE